MSERGVFAVDRRIWDHDILNDKNPLSRREAWLWLLSEAAWKPHRRRVSGRVFNLERGQLVASLRFIASKWRWTEPRVRRFLGLLKSDSMIVAKSDAGVTVITICKYTEYQRVSLPSDAPNDSASDAGATQERRKVEDRESMEVSVSKETGGTPPTDEFPDQRKQVFDMALPTLKAQGQDERNARSIIGRWRKLSGGDDSALVGLLAEAGRVRPANLVEWMGRCLSTKRDPPRHYKTRTQVDTEEFLAEFGADDGIG